MMKDNLPRELLDLKQWVVADNSRVPYRPNDPILPASSVKPADWSDFDTAIKVVKPYLGFVFARGGGIVGIDLDNKNLDNPKAIEDFHNQILEDFADCYIEKSISGTGYHIICKGSLGLPADSEDGGTNNRLNHVEIYEHSRYFTVSGNVINCPDTLPDKTELCTELFDRLRGDGIRMTGVIESVPSTITDEDVLSSMASASNWLAIEALLKGQFSDYPSQSEADMALMSHILFYTKDHDQATRLFMGSELSPEKRPPSKRKPKPERYVQRTIQNALKGDPTLAVDLDGFILEARNIVIDTPAQPEAAVIDFTPSDAPPTGPLNFIPAPKREAVSQAKRSEFPVGITGDIANYIYESSIRPVPEVALAGALALMAGICGRSYNVSGTGLNHYIMLLAGTGVGKEGAASGIERLVNAVRELAPQIDSYVGPAAFASGQAIVKTLDEKPCFISVMGEFGITLQSMCSPKAPTHLAVMRRVMLDLYNKSGSGQVLRSSVYADSEKNTKMISSPAMSILGESNANTFYSSLDSSHIADGLIPRFNFIDYRGIRPPRNRNFYFAPSGELVGAVLSIVQHGIQAQQNNASHDVTISPEAEEVYDLFDDECDDRINSDSGGGVFAEVWNRAHLKSLKLGALIAIGVNPYAPVITRDVCEWAIEFTRTDIASITRRAEDGELSGGEGKRLADMARVIEKFMTDDLKNLKGITKKMRDDRVVPHRWLFQRLKGNVSFKNDYKSGSQLLKDTTAFMCETGYLVRLPDPTQYGTTATMYQIIDPNGIINHT